MSTRLIRMSKKNKTLNLPDYEGIGLNSEMAYIQKARPLQSLSATDLTLPEFKILDAYLARINSHEPEKRTIKIERGALEKILGVSRILKDDLDKRLRHLFQVIEIKDDRKGNGFKLISLFEEAEAEQDENGLWQITLTCSPSAREYIFNIDNIGYLRYRLKNIVNLTSRYSYVLFLYLLDNRFRKSWIIDLTELRTLLNCNADTYKQYYRFNDLILKKCHQELIDKTDLRFSYSPIKRGRSVTAVNFTIETISAELADEHLYESERQLTFDDQQDDDEKWISLYGSEQLAILAEGCRYEFDKEQMEQIARVLVRIHIPKERATNDLTYGKQFYLQEKYAALNVEASKKVRNKEKPINDRFRYFLSMLEDDAFQPAAYKE